MIQTQKQKLRKIMLTKRKALSAAQARAQSAQIINQLKTVPQFLQADSFFIYVAVDNEVETQALIQDLLTQNKIVTVPKIINQTKMIAVQITKLEQLIKTTKFYEPKNSNAYQGKIDVCITPGLAFTKNLDRLGQGGGYYDRFLKQNPDIFAIGLAYDWQILDEVPISKNDQKVDLIVSQQKSL